MYETLDTEKNKFVQVSIQQDGYPCIVQWNALEKLVSTGFCINERQIEDSGVVKQGLLRTFTSFRFVAVTAFIPDISLILNKLCLAFQKKTIDFSFATFQTDIIIKYLENLNSG